MNQAQKNFAIDRVHKILKGKFKQIIQEDTDKADAYATAIKVPLAAIILGIDDGSLSLIPKSKLKDNSGATSIGSVYDLSKLEAAFKLLVNPADTPTSVTIPVIRLFEPGCTSDYSATSFNPKFKANALRAKKITIVYRNAQDQIMLGNNSGALKAIQEIEARSF